MSFISFFKKYFRQTSFVIAILLALLGSYFRVFELYELQTYDWRCQVRGPRPVSPNIVLVDIWNDALEQFGVWPFDREYHSYLIQILGNYGAKAVLFDILFSEQSEHDKQVVQAAKDTKNAYFAFSFADPKPHHRRFLATKIDSDLAPGYREAAKGIGFVNTKADIDGKRRRSIPVIFYRGKKYYQLAFRAAVDALGGKIENIDFKPGHYVDLTEHLRIPLDEDSCFIINYASRWESKNSFPHYSYQKVLYSYHQVLVGEKPSIDLHLFKDKICIIGLTSQGSQDISPIPIQSVYPMVGSYANILNNILQKDFIRRADRWTNLILLILFGALIGWISMKYKPLLALFYTLAATSIFTELVVWVFCAFGWWADLFYPLVIFIVLYASTTLLRTLTEMRKRELIESELKIASQIQKSFLPETLPEIKSISMAVYFKPAKAVGGDLYAFIKLSSDSKLGVMVGDVSGKGTPAALFMAKTVSEFKFSARDCLDPSQALLQVNNGISSETTGGLFVTMAYAIFDVGEKKLLISNGGHLPVAAVRAEGKEELLSPGEGMPIGVMEGVPFSNLEYALRPGDVFAFYTDGISEARNRKKEEYGIERLQKMISLHREKPVEDILSKTVEDLNFFMGKADQHDDITLILVKIGAVA